MPTHKNAYNIIYSTFWASNLFETRAIFERKYSFRETMKGVKNKLLSIF